MKTFAIVVLTVLATLSFLLIAAGFTLRWWVRRRILAAIAAGETPGTGIAPTIHFEPVDADSRWQQASTPAVFERFAALGYLSSGRFRVPEIAGMEVVFGTHPDGTAVALYDHQSIPTFFDVVRMAKDETSAYVTTTPLHNPAHTPPGVVVVADESLAPEEGVDLLRGLRPTGEVLKATAENICALAAGSYERQIAHILLASAPTGDQMLAVGERIAAVTQTEAPVLDEDELRFAAQIHRFERERALIEVILQTFRRSHPFSDAEWETMRDRIVVLHDRMDREEREERLPDPEAAKILGRVDHPLPATFYLLER